MGVPVGCPMFCVCVGVAIDFIQEEKRRVFNMAADVEDIAALLFFDRAAGVFRYKSVECVNVVWADAKLRNNDISGGHATARGAGITRSRTSRSNWRRNMA